MPPIKKSIGEYKNNVRDGQGFLVFKGDTIKSGIWKKNKFTKKIKLKNVTRYIKMTYPKYKKSKQKKMKLLLIQIL